MRFRLGPFILDLETRQLTRRGREIHLTPKAFDLLAALVVERPKILTKDVLQHRLWPDTFVVDANLSNLVGEIREALGDDGRKPAWIRTAHAVGYAFCGHARVVSRGREGAAADRSPCWLEWGQQRFPLSTGQHIIGRDSAVQIRLDASTVSRRHARLVVLTQSAFLEDLGSKNGTRRGSERITSPVPLTDGDEIRIGSLLVTFHLRASLRTTETQRQ